MTINIYSLRFLYHSFISGDTCQTFHRNESRSSDKIPHKLYQVPFDPGSLEEFAAKTAIEEGIIMTLINLTELQRVACDHLLNDTELLQDLRNFDLIVFEGSAQCSVLVSKLLGIPRVVIVAVGPSHGVASHYNIPLPVSYVPTRFTQFTNKMSFTQRLVNLGLYILNHLVLQILFARFSSPLKDKYNITSHREACVNDELVILSIRSHFFQVCILYMSPPPPPYPRWKSWNVAKMAAENRVLVRECDGLMRLLPSPPRNR